MAYLSEAQHRALRAISKGEDLPLLPPVRALQRQRLIRWMVTGWELTPTGRRNLGGLR